MLALLGASLATAQRPPRLRAGADTNDPAAYLRLGRDMLGVTHRSGRAVAESALVWAARLDPGSGQPAYLLAIAILRPTLVTAALPGPWANYYAWRAFRGEPAQRVDSLLREAWLREPFQDLELDPLLVVHLIPSPDLAPNAIERAYYAYQLGDYPRALASWGEALARSPDRIDLRLHRAHTFYWLRQYDSTVAELQTALASTTRSDSAPSPLLPPTHVLQYALGVVYERIGNADSASEAYRRALVADLGLYMARVRLAGILLARGDTADAVREVAIAVDVAPSDPWVVGHYGSVLLQAGRPADAVIQLRSAIDLDSAYSIPYFLLGVAYSALHRDREALPSFEAFLLRAPRNEERRSWTMQRVASLRTAVADSVGPE